MKYLLVFIGMVSIIFIWIVNPKTDTRTLIEIFICLNCFFWAGILEIKDTFTELKDKFKIK